MSESSSTNNRHPVENGVYRHNKTGNLYEVVGTALHTETGETLVAYRPADKARQSELFVRPRAMFDELVVINGQSMPRFERVETPRSFIV